VKRWRQRREEEAVARKWASVDDGAVPSTSTGITHSQPMQGKRDVLYGGVAIYKHSQRCVDHITRPDLTNAGINLYTKDHVGEVCVVEVTQPNSFRFALASVYIHHNVS
jgi:hypothetical protein